MPTGHAERDDRPREEIVSGLLTFESTSTFFTFDFTDSTLDEAETKAVAAVESVLGVTPMVLDWIDGEDSARVVVVVDGDASWTEAAAGRADELASTAGAEVTSRAVTHDDGMSCSAEGKTVGGSGLCDVIAHPDTTVEDIKAMKFGHAQFECGYQLLETKQYEKLIAYAWCIIGHCPTAASCIFPLWTEEQCESEIHNWLGFAYRSDESDPAEIEEYQEKGYAHYHKSLELWSENYGTWGYLGQLYILQGDRNFADVCLTTLCRGAGQQHHSTEVVLRDFISTGWSTPSCEEGDVDLDGALAILPNPTVSVERDDAPAVGLNQENRGDAESFSAMISVAVLIYLF
jgi:hypothetical protein